MLTQAIKDLKAQHRFRDPVYGFIKATDAEMKIIDTPVFQRLRRIHQLALTKYVYPGAEHSRFVHSLGVMQAATEVFGHILDDEKVPEEVKSNIDKYFTKVERISLKEGISLALKRLRFAALLHDVGHLPFSHATEKLLLGEQFDHEDVGRYIIIEHPEISETIRQEGVDPVSVGNLIKSYGSSPSWFDLLLGSVISGQFDVDRADYLLRDSYYCGVRYGEYDYKRYLSTIRIKNSSPLEFIITADDVPIMEEFLLARYHYNLQVPFHRTRVGYDIALKEFVEKDCSKWLSSFGEIASVSDKKIESLDFDRFTHCDDYSFFDTIFDDDKTESFWGRCLKRQEHLEMAYERLDTVESGSKEARKVKEALESAGIKYYPWEEKLELHKLTENKTSDEKETTSFFVVDREGEIIALLEEYSPFFKAFTKSFPFIWRIYGEKGNKETIRNLIFETIGRGEEKINDQRAAKESSQICD